MVVMRMVGVARRVDSLDFLRHGHCPGMVDIVQRGRVGVAKGQVPRLAQRTTQGIGSHEDVKRASAYVVATHLAGVGAITGDRDEQLPFGSEEQRLAEGTWL